MSTTHNGQPIAPYIGSPHIGSTPVDVAAGGGGGGGGGATWYAGDGIPSGALGITGDMYLDRAAVALYGPKTGSGWGSPVSLVGPPGAPGTPGAPGAPGAGGSTNLSYDAAGRIIASDTGTDAQLPVAGTSGNAGLMTAADKTKLDGIEPGATTDMTNGEIETAYNAQVPVVTQSEAQAGTLTNVRRWTPQRVAQAIAALAPTGGGGLDTAAGDARYLKLDSVPVNVLVPLSSLTGAITASTTTPVNSFRLPFPMILTGIRATLGTADNAATTVVDIHGNNGNTIFTTKLTIDANEKSSLTAATPALAAVTTFSDDDELTFYVDAVGSVARDLKVWLIGYRTAVNFNTPPAPPSAPIFFTVNSSLDAFFYNATSNGSAITGYEAEHRAVGAGSWLTAPTPLPGNIALVGLQPGRFVPLANVSTLAAGVPHEVRIRAISSDQGPGAWSPAVQFTPGAVPATPAAPTFANVLDTSMTINWVAPSAGGHPINRVVLQRATNSAFTLGLTTLLTDDTSPFAITFNDTGLTPSTTYFYRVTYRNAAGSSVAGTGGSQATSSGAGSPPGAISIATFLVTSGSGDFVGGTATAQWTAPADNGSAIIRYEWRWSLDGVNNWTAPISLGSDVTSPWTLTDATLPSGDFFSLQLRAVNANGNGPWSAAIGSQFNS